MSDLVRTSSGSVLVGPSGSPLDSVLEDGQNWRIAEIGDNLRDLSAEQTKMTTEAAVRIAEIQGLAVRDQTRPGLVAVVCGIVLLAAVAAGVIAFAALASVDRLEKAAPILAPVLVAVAVGGVLALRAALAAKPPPKP